MSQPNPEHPNKLPPPNQLSTDKCPLEQKRTIPRFKVVLLRSAMDDLMFIVRSLMEVTRFPRAEATHKMWESHHCGRSVLLTTYLERAELYVEQFTSKGLKVTIEPI